MSHNYIVTAQKPTAVTACVTGKRNLFLFASCQEQNEYSYTTNGIHFFSLTVAIYDSLNLGYVVFINRNV